MPTKTVWETMERILLEKYVSFGEVYVLAILSIVHYCYFEARKLGGTGLELPPKATPYFSARAGRSASAGGTGHAHSVFELRYIQIAPQAATFSDSTS